MKLSVDKYRKISFCNLCEFLQSSASVRLERWWCSFHNLRLSALPWMAVQTNSWVAVSPHLVQEKGVGCWGCLPRSFRLFLLSKVAVLNASSANFAPCLTVCLQDWRSSAMLSHKLLSMLHRFMSLLQTSLKRSLGRPACREPSTSSPYKRSLGMWPGSIFLTWPNQRSRLSQRMVYIDLMLAHSSTSVLLILSCHFMCRIPLSHLWWKLLGFFSCLA